MKQQKSRREILRSGLYGAAGSLVASGIAKAQIGSCLTATPAQTEGPFYPEETNRQPIPVDEVDLDLTKVAGRNQIARGEILRLKVTVSDPDCRPISGATVDLWQACATGRYNHTADPNEAELDPDFQYQGIGQTNSEGSLTFRTVKPGAYPAASGWTRPAHIHFIVEAEGYQPLTTQMYFAGESLNLRDRILQGLSPAERNNVVVEFNRPSMNELPEGEFRIVLNPL